MSTPDTAPTETADTAISATDKAAIDAMVKDIFDPTLGPAATTDQTAELKKRISRLRVRLTQWAPFFGYLLLKLDIHVALPEHRVPTMGVTRDRKLYLNHEFCASLTDPEFVFVLCHEVMHLALLCFEREQGRNKKVWNFAHDYAINQSISEMIHGIPEIKMPAKGLIDVKYAKMSAEEIYDQIIDEIIQNGGMPGGAEEGIGQDMRDDLSGDSGSDKRSEAEKNALDRYWKTAILEAAQKHDPKRGNLPWGIQKMIDEIVDPKIPWVDVLSRWVGTHGRRVDYTYSRPARRSESVGEFLPAQRKFGVDDVVVLWDTSGSMNGRETEILSEVCGICADLGLSLRVICCDCSIHSDQSGVTEPGDVDVKGGGGSDFNPAFNLLREEGYQGVLVAFTDGYIGVPETKPDNIKAVLWVMHNGEPDPTGGKWGEVLSVDEKGFAK